MAEWISTNQNWLRLGGCSSNCKFKECLCRFCWARLCRLCADRGPLAPRSLSARHLQNFRARLRITCSTAQNKSRRDNCTFIVLLAAVRHRVLGACVCAVRPPSGPSIWNPCAAGEAMPGRRVVVGRVGARHGARCRTGSVKVEIVIFREIMRWSRGV